jgi:hypothetical protein
LKQQISFIGQKWSKETLGGHGTPFNLGMSRSAVGNASNCQAAQVFFANCKISHFG